MEMIRSKIISPKLELEYYKESNGNYIEFFIEANIVGDDGGRIFYRVSRSISRLEIESCNLNLVKDTKLRLVLSLRKAVNNGIKK